MSYTKSFKKQVLDLCQNGTSVSVVAKECAVPRGTIYRWLKEESFVEASEQVYSSSDIRAMERKIAKMERIVAILKTVPCIVHAPLKDRLDALEQLLGCHIVKSNSSQLLGVALRQAHTSRNPSPGLVFHSDRGKPYCSKAFITKLEQYGMVQSLSRTGKPHDNAVMESFFSSMKRESLYRREYPSESAFRQGVFQHIEFYNTKRPHTYLKHKTPTQFEQAYYEKHPISRQGSDC